MTAALGRIILGRSEVAMKRAFIIVGWIEGISLLLLLFVAMPLKYIWMQPEMVRQVGMAHGLLFMLYVVGAINLALDESWGWKKLTMALVLSSVPFGTFIFEKKYL